MESEHKQLKSNIKSIEKTVKFYQENDTCPSCKQDIQEHHKDCIFQESEKEHKDIVEQMEELSSNIENTEKRLSDINVVLGEVHSFEKQIADTPTHS